MQGIFTHSTQLQTQIYTYMDMTFYFDNYKSITDTLQIEMLKPQLNHNE